MSFGIAVKTLDSAGGAHVAEKQNFFKVQGQPVSQLGAHVLPHPPSPPHTSGPPMVQASTWFKINGIGAVRQGHLAQCGHPSTGRSWFRISG